MLPPRRERLSCVKKEEKEIPEQGRPLVSWTERAEMWQHKGVLGRVS